MSYAQELQRALEAAVEQHAFEVSGPGQWKALERVVGAVLSRERSAGRIRAFAVRCDEELNPPGSDATCVEVSYQPPAPRAKAVVLRLVAR